MSVTSARVGHRCASREAVDGEPCPSPPERRVRFRQDLEDISQIKEEVDASRIILSFVSAGYFESRPCQREVRGFLLWDGAAPFCWCHRLRTLGAHSGSTPLRYTRYIRYIRHIRHISYIRYIRYSGSTPLRGWRVSTTAPA